MLGCVPTCQMVYQSVNMLVLPDPRLTQEGPVKFPASYVCAYTHHSMLLHLSLVFAFVTFSSQMEQH